MKENVKRILREHVEQHEYDIDPSDIWAGMQAKQKKDDRSNRFLIWFFFGSMLLVAFGIWNYNQPKKNNTKSDESIQQVEATSQIASVKQTQLSNKSESTGTNHKNILDNKINNTIAQEDKSETNTLITANISYSTSKFSNRTTPPSNSTNSYKLPSSSISTASSVQAPFSGIQNTAEAEANEVISSENNTINILDETQTQRPKLDLTTTISLLPQTPIYQNRKSTHTILPSISIERDRNWFISCIGSYGFTANTLTAHNQSGVALTGQREALTTPLESLHAAIHFGRKLTPFLKLSAGIKYTRINSKFEWNGSYLSDENGNLVDSTLPDFNFSAGNFYQEVNRNVVSYNYHEVLSIPVRLHLYKERHKLSYGIFGGINFPISNKTFGHTLNEELIPISLSSIVENFSPELETGISLTYQFTQGWSLISQCSVSRITVNETNASSEFRMFNIGLGLSKSL